jgi:hypothetical protein
MISAELPSVNPMPAAAQPEYEFSIEITTGMSAPPIGIDQERAEHQRDDAPVFDGVDLLPKLRDEPPSAAISIG